jgi:hypothetical protein
VQCPSCAIGNGPDDCLDDFVCYDLKAKTKLKKKQVHLDDPFNDLDYDLSASKEFCNPARKNVDTENDQWVNRLIHLNGYKVKPSDDDPETLPTVLVTNQFGTITVALEGAERLLVPATKSVLDHYPAAPDITTHLVDHYLCYEVRLISGDLPEHVQLEDQFTSPGLFPLIRPLHGKQPPPDGPKRFDVDDLERVCLPVAKNGECVKQDFGLTCYEIDRKKGEPKHKKRTARIADQFGQHKVETKIEAQLCVPSEVAVLPD